VDSEDFGEELGAVHASCRVRCGHHFVARGSNFNVSMHLGLICETRPARSYPSVSSVLWRPSRPAIFSTPLNRQRHDPINDERVYCPPINRTLPQSPYIGGITKRG